MKIAQIVCTFPPYPGGIGVAAEQFAASLSARGHKVDVLTTATGSTPEKRRKNYGVIFLKPLLKYGNGAIVPGAIKYLANYDIVHLHYPFFGAVEFIWLKELFFRKHNYKLYLHYHMDVKSSALVVKIGNCFNKLIWPSFFNKIVGVSCASFDYIENSSIKKSFFRSHNKFMAIPFGVDVNKFYPAQTANEEKTVHFLFVGGLDKAHYFKGLDSLLTALSGLGNLPWHLGIVGDGYLRQKFEKQVHILGLKDKIKFYGRLSEEDLIKAYQTHQALVLPSINTNEAFGIVLIEAMSCGLAVISSDLPGVRGVFRNKEQGLFTKPGDIGSLRTAIKELIADRKKLQKFGQAGRKLALEKYDLSLLGEKLESFYKK